jgi:beta-lactamase superfamily II metal-dependent hydrolase
MFTLEMLAADYGDALWLEYGTPDAPHIVVIDGGPQKANSPLLQRLKQRASNGAPVHVELMVVTHVDADHIDGVLATVEALPPSVTFGDVWFNGFRHLLPPDQLGAAAGERLSKRLGNATLPWNASFRGAAIAVEKTGDLPQAKLAGGLNLTVLSPTRVQLRALHEVWRSVLLKSGLAADQLGEIPDAEQEADPCAASDLLGRDDEWPPDVTALAQKRPKRDTAQANGSSIGLLAEYDMGRHTAAVLLGADCFAPVLEASIDRLLLQRKLEHLKLDAFKLPHHGSRFNLTNTLLARLKCSRYLVSTSGARFQHPDHEALARVIQHGGKNPELMFNYDVETTRRWRNPPDGAPPYRTTYGKNELKVDLG